MITRFFGLPGCGKTTIAAKICFEALRSGKFAAVYGNVSIGIPGFTYIPFTYVGQYMLRDCCLIIDEAAIECGNRDFKNFTKDRIEFFMTHRHYNCTVFLFSQEPDGVDTKIRSLTDHMYYIKKGALFGRWFSTVYRIPYGLVWPSENSNGENLGRIVMGYVKPSFFARLFAQRIYRPKYYPYFDSWEIKQLPPLPESATTVPGSIAVDRWVLAFFNKTRILLRWQKRYKKTQKRLARKEKRKLRRSDRRAQDGAALQRLEQVGVYDLSPTVKIS